MRRRASAPIWLSLVLLTAASTSSRVAAQDPESARVEAIAALARSAYDEWLGPGEQAVTGSDYDDSFFNSRGAMSVESAVAYALARRRFAHVTGDDRAIADGIAWYLQSRVVERAFDRAFLRPGYRFQTTCFFGCRVPWPLPLIVSRWNDGIGRPEYLRSLGSRRWPVLDHRLPDGVGLPAVRAALLFASLERELGWPALQAALRAVAGTPDGRRVVEIVEAATARQLAPVFALALAAAPADYGLQSVTSSAHTCGGAPCVLTRIALTRTGEIPYALRLDLQFADRSTASTYWDGVGVIEFESAAAASAVSLDRGRAWLLDTNFSNNDYEAARATNVEVTKWITRWVMWLQDAMLTYSFPI